ncbi:hypothetical protein TH53_15080 [Pedobacter lusitanus]|uniref:Uncharacterized protein n=1 Tax=Pedobacter lusitanus TaxID=1503925 RepID=A0A0D0F4A6_9SPHI|nr:DUF6660 family protein [Pedobacter lusitanus]KIO76393.1 hypothetical protein TH53_15080 [Pedobacter lusitanus]
MRLLSFIGIVLVLALNLVPCGDAVAALNGNTKIEKAHHTERNNDNCSPFCNCACCSTASVIKDTLIIVSPVEDHIPALPAHQAGKFITVDLPIWQPPQLLA